MNLTDQIFESDISTMTVIITPSPDSDHRTFSFYDGHAGSNVTSGRTTSPSAMEPEVRDILWQYKNNRSITTPLYYVILCSYITIGVLAIFSNSLVVLAVIRNKKVRTPRNLLIFNLAVTDLALAATIPFSASDALSKYWPWDPTNNFLCKVSHSLPTTLVFMVSMIIITIAVDRYRCIVVRTQVQLGRVGALLVLPGAFVVSSGVSIPLLVHSQLVTLPQKVVTRIMKDSADSPGVAFCMEKWSDTNAADLILTQRAIYSILVAVFQYLLPLLVVLFIYALIYKYLSEQQYPRHLRQSKTNKLLASISLTHCVIWLPFSIFNILADLIPSIFGKDPGETIITVYCMVHLVGLTSTCTNPVLYAFFNENLRREFDGIFDWILPGYRSEDGSQRRTPGRRRRRPCRILFRKKRQSSGGSSLRSQRINDDFGGAVTLMTVQQGSIETIGSEADLAVIGLMGLQNDQEGAGQAGQQQAEIDSDLEQQQQQLPQIDSEDENEENDDIEMNVLNPPKIETAKFHV